MLDYLYKGFLTFGLGIAVLWMLLIILKGAGVFGFVLVFLLIGGALFVANKFLSAKEKSDG